MLFRSFKDGTMVPIVISHKKGLKFDGKNPTILYDYGGFNVDRKNLPRKRNRLRQRNGQNSKKPKDFENAATLQDAVDIIREKAQEK